MKYSYAKKGEHILRGKPMRRTKNGHGMLSGPSPSNHLDFESGCMGSHEDQAELSITMHKMH